MRNRSVVIRNRQCMWKPQNKRKTEIQKKINTSGFISPIAVVVVFAVSAALMYIYSINQSAVKGLQIRKIEKEISRMSRENELLKIKEAELKSLYKIEKFSKERNMSDAAEIIFLDEVGSLALNSSSSKTIK